MSKSWKGLYLHHKGNFYWATGLTIDSETGSHRVEYQNFKGHKFSRPIEMWHQTVTREDGTRVSRFKKIEEKELVEKNVGSPD